MKKFISWNVNGLRAVQQKGFLAWLAHEQPHFLALQETKAAPEQLDEALRQPQGYHSYWASASLKKGYSGVAIYSQNPAQHLESGLGIADYDQEGRTLIADYGDFLFISAYFPSGSADTDRIPFKLAYCAAFLEYIERRRAEGRSIIFCGDLNIAHQPIDLARPKENTKNSGFLPEERAWLDSLLERGYVDVYRLLHPTEEGAYTWWSQRSGARERNIGWRLDMFFISGDLQERVRDAAIHREVLGSDHCPISITLDV